MSSIGGTGLSIGTRTISGSFSRHKASSANTLHVLSISASVTKLRWRPPAFDTYNTDDDDNVDRHDSMLAVATARLTSAGGSGVLSLWSVHRPFMPLSIVEGHEEGAVTDFVWLDTPQPRKFGVPKLTQSESGLSRNRKGQGPAANDSGEALVLRASGRDVESILFDNKEKEKEEEKSSLVYVWQHVLSVGRDGRCILQSFARGKNRFIFLSGYHFRLTGVLWLTGERPITRVPASCFAMANLSPFQQGYGSLQLFSIYQQVPSGRKCDFLLTGLRQDEYTARAPGIFREVPVEDTEGEQDETDGLWLAGKRLPGECLRFKSFVGALSRHFISYTLLII